jgi:hypothetical protein
MTSVLHDKVAIALRRVDPDEYRAIAERTGLSLSWIRAFAANRIPNPSASRLETLYKGITGHAIVIRG